MLKDIDIDELVKDRKAFNKFVYTPFDEAIKEIGKRKSDKSIHDLNFVPGILKKAPRAIMFRQLVTPNYEISRFVSISELCGLEPLFFEYYNDKFTSNNVWKHSLGKMFFCKGRSKDGQARVETLNVIDFNRSNGKSISSVKTLWGQSLVNFHHELFIRRFKNFKDIFFDASNWFHDNGGNASGYYKQFLSLFIKDAILFDNFLLDDKELTFTKEVFLLAFISIIKETGVKPLIVALEPTEIEEDRFWMCHPYEDIKFVHYKLSSIPNKIWIKLKELFIL
ncbi:MAG: hypothetical protein WAX85_02480 [Minisyncoccia bacterium]